MILKKVKKDDTIKAIYKSSNILASEFNTLTNNLEIIFNRGDKYLYKGVTVNDYTRFEIAESQGKVLNSHIKVYPFEQLEKIDPQTIINEINEIAKAELKALGEGIVVELQKAIEEFSQTGNYSKQILNNIQYLISRYQTDGNE